MCNIAWRLTNIFPNENKNAKKDFIKYIKIYTRLLLIYKYNWLNEWNSLISQDYLCEEFGNIPLNFFELRPFIKTVIGIRKTENSF